MPFPVSEGALCVCEGEKKTLAANQAHLNAVGIGGVWSWLSKGEPIDDLQLVEWENRDAIIIPDSDVFERPDLMRAIYALGRELREHGAAVTVARIPQEGQDKLGLDDYLVAGGAVVDEWNGGRKAYSTVGRDRILNWQAAVAAFEAVMPPPRRSWRRRPRPSWCRPIGSAAGCATWSSRPGSGSGTPRRSGT